MYGVEAAVGRDAGREVVLGGLPWRLHGALFSFLVSPVQSFVGPSLFLRGIEVLVFLCKFASQLQVLLAECFLVSLDLGDVVMVTPGFFVCHCNGS